MVATVGRCYTNHQDYAQENYYSQGEGLVNSEWLGKAATAQGLNGQIQEKHFHNAYQALDPNGTHLRKQQNYSKSSKRHNRPGTDVTLSAPKSISVAALVMGERQILEAHKEAVRSTMEYVENHCLFYQTKHQGKKLLLESKTAQIAIFHHDDNRNKDPQLHSHCVILNQTLCPDGKWRAVANEQLYVQIKTIGAYYAHELARQLKERGWEIEWTSDHTFELAGIDKDKLDAIFSTRSNQIEAELVQQGLTRNTATAEQKQALCLKTRKEKKHHQRSEDREQQLEEWQQRAREAGIEIERQRLETIYWEEDRGAKETRGREAGEQGSRESRGVEEQGGLGAFKDMFLKIEQETDAEMGREGDGLGDAERGDAERGEEKLIVSPCPRVPASGVSPCPPSLESKKPTLVKGAGEQKRGDFLLLSDTPSERNDPIPRSFPELLHCATEILSERATAFQKHEFLKECLRQSQGKYDPVQIQAEIELLCRGAEGSRSRGEFSSLLLPYSRGQVPLELLPTQDGRLTTKNQLLREQTIIQLATSGRDSREPLASSEQVQAIALKQNLNPGQTTALMHMATSRDAVVLVQGNAGVGKTYTMRALKDLIDGVMSDKGTGDRRGHGDTEIQRHGEFFFTASPSPPSLESKKHTLESSSSPLLSYSPAPSAPSAPLLPCFPSPLVPIRGLAPSAAAANVLQTESGISSQTLASYLLTPDEQFPKNEILLVDEAGMLSSKQMEQLLEKAQATNSRIILVGDTKQLSAVEAGAPFKLLQDQDLPTAIIDQNLRQRDPSLRQIVDLMATHDQDSDSVNQAYQRLDNQGKIQQIANDSDRIHAIAQDYLSRPLEIRDRTLILAGMNADKQAIANTVRQGLIHEGILGSESLQIKTLRRKDLDKFAITQPHHYQRGDVIKFQTDNAQFSRDSYYRVTAVNPEANTFTLIDTVGSDYTLPLDKYKQREVYQVQPLEIRPGERMRFTKNIRNQDYKQLNGQWFTVEGLTDDGQITLKTNGKTQNVPASQLLHSDYRYVDTVHSSQGQTADYCIYSASPAKSQTIGRESFYVAASRAKREFVVYTASTQDLGVTVQISRTNENALDLVNSRQEKALTARVQEKPAAGKSVLVQDTSIAQAASSQSPEATSLGQQPESVILSEKAALLESRKEFNPVRLTKLPQETSRGKRVAEALSEAKGESEVTGSSSAVPSRNRTDLTEQSSLLPLSLTDAQLLTLSRSVEQWKKTCPPEPSLEKGKSYKKRIEELTQQKAHLEKKLRSHQQELQELGQPRSLLNPFGVKAEIIEAKKIEIWATRMELGDTERELSHVWTDFKQWQKQARTYLAWRENPQNVEMSQLAEQLKSPAIQARLQRIEEGYAVHTSAQYILAQKGVQSESERYFQGQVYRLSERGKTLTIYHKDRSEPIYLATDRRETGGIIEISQFNLMQTDKEMIQGYAKYLEEQQRLQKSRQVEY